MHRQLKALISARAKKFIASQLFVTNFYFKGTKQFTVGVFPSFVTLGHLLFKGDYANVQKRWPWVTKPIKVGKILLCAYKVKICSKYLASYKLLSPS